MTGQVSITTNSYVDLLRIYVDVNMNTYDKMNDRIN